MRIDLEQSAHRPRTAKLGLAVMNRIVGIKPGPVLTFTYHPELFDPTLHGYWARGVRHQGSWSKGEAELFATFVSDLNTCRF
jgi:hypothetical protein